MGRRFSPPLKLRRRSWGAFALAFFGFGGAAVLALVGARVFGVTGLVVQTWLSGFAGSPWGLAAAIVIFASLAFLGAPQIVLIAAAVAAFGPWRGAVYSWSGTMVSAAVGFGLGRRFAGRLLSAESGAGVRRFVRSVGRNGLIASLLVRLVPAAPFVLINMAAGATPMLFADFMTGTAIGIVPKIAITAMGAAGVGAVSGAGGLTNIGLIAAALLLWAALGFVARTWIRRWDVADDT